MPLPIPQNDHRILIAVRSLIIKNGKLSLLFSHNPECGLHVFDGRIAKFWIFQQVSTIHQTLEIVDYGFLVDRAFHTFNDHASRFNPTYVAEHYMVKNRITL